MIVIDPLDEEFDGFGQRAYLTYAQYYFTGFNDLEQCRIFEQRMKRIGESFPKGVEEPTCENIFIYQ